MSKIFTPANVAKTFAVKLSPRYQRFLARAEHQTYDRRFADVPTYASPIRVRFQGAELESFFRSDDDERRDAHPASTEVDLGGPDGWVPLATLGEEEAQFLVVKASEPACPVAMWEHETGRFVPCAASLDDFLAALGTTKEEAKPNEPAAGAAELSRIAERGAALLDGRLTKAKKAEIAAVLAELEPLTKRLPSEQALAGGEYHGLPERALYVKGKMLRAVGRFEEACSTFEHAVIDGKKRTIALETLADTLLSDLDRADRVVAICEAASETPWFVRRTWALALLRLGRRDDAAALLRASVAAQVTSRAARDPKLDRAAETTKWVGLLREPIMAYAKKRGLVADAEKLLADAARG